MVLIILVLSLLLEKYYRDIDRLRNWNWYRNYLQWIIAKLTNHRITTGPIGIVLLHLFVLLPLYLVLLVLDDISIFLSFAASLAILVFSLGPRNLHEEIQAFIHTEKAGDPEGALHQLHNILGDTIPADEQKLFRTVIGNIFAQSNERLLAVIFWFVVLGPIGAALVRLACLSKQYSTQADLDPNIINTMAQLQHILLWIPARLTAASFAVTGSFVHTFENWRQHEKWAAQWPDSNECILVACGFGALNIDLSEENPENVDIQHIQAALNLTMRAAITGVVIYSLAILTGWPQ